MRVVVDTNIAFSAILNTNSLISRILLQPKSNLNFYSTDLLMLEINEHKGKIRKLSGYSNKELDFAIKLITSRIRFIDLSLIPANILIASENLLKDIDIDDTEFIALTNHINGKLWSGDKVLQNGLIKIGWKKFVSTKELYQFINKKK